MSGVQKCEWEPTKMINATPDVAGRWFGLDAAAIEAQCGRFAKGKRKGELRGWIVYRKCRVGGWCFPLNCVIRPGLMFAHFCRTYDEACETANYPTDRFFPATRVDTYYGHTPEAARQEAAERFKADQEKRAAEAAAKEKGIYDITIDAMWESYNNDENPAMRIAIKQFQNAREEFIEGGWPRWAAYNSESVELSAAAAGGQI